jgi:hypothetical protein
VALLIGCIARRARLIGFGVTARFAVRTGCIALRADRGTNILEKKPTTALSRGPATYVRFSIMTDRGSGAVISARNWPPDRGAGGGERDAPDNSHSPAR